MDGRRIALIVAGDQYEHEGLRRLSAPMADAEALGRALGDPQIGEFDVHVLHNEPSHILQARIEDFFSESRSDDVLLLHFSCHGLKSESGDLFFAARNTRPNRLGSTAISADFVQRCMRQSRSRCIVLLLDCCYGGAFAQGVTVRASGDVNVLDSFPAGKQGGGRGRAVITASNAMEYAFEDDTLADDHSQRPSVFTAALVEGLTTGEADRDEDGWVSLNELYDYVFERVRERNPHQTPSRDVEMQGEMYLARSRRRRIRALPLPADLEAARTAPDMYTRLGAVSEIRARLNGDNIEAAAGAHTALTDTARTDIRFVAEPAQAALREAAIQPAPTALHFGQVAQGSPAPHQTIQLLGPPIARAATPHASDDWIRLNETIDGIDISIDTARVGTLHGTVDVKGPAGRTLVTIDVEVVPPPSEPAPPPRSGPRASQSPAPLPTPRPQPGEAAAPRQSPPSVTPPGAQTPLAADGAQTGSATPAGNGDTTSAGPHHATAPATRRTRTSTSTSIVHIFWALIPLLSVGFLAPVPFAHAAIRLRDRRLWLAAGAYLIAFWLIWLSLMEESGAAGPYVVFLGVVTVHALRLRRRVFPEPPASSSPTGR